MKKFYLIMIATFAASICFAQQRSLLKRTDAEKANTLVASLSKGNLLPSNAFRGISKQSPKKSGKTAIRTPKGVAHNMALNTFVASSEYNGLLGGYCDTVYVDGKDVYFKNFVTLVGDGSYIKGVITSGDEHNGTITIANMQETSAGYSAVIAKTDSSGYSLIPDSTTKDFKFTIKNDTISSNPVEATGGDMYILGVDDQSGYYVCYNSSYQFDPVDESVLSPVVIPQGIAMKRYIATDDPIQKGGSQTKSIINIGRDGDDFYFADIISGMPSSVMKGRLKDGKIIISVPQYMGKIQNYYITTKKGELYWKKDQYGDSTISYRVLNDVADIACDYDAATGAIKLPCFVGFCAGNSTIGYFYNTQFKAFSYTPVVIPTTAVSTNYAVSIEANSNNGQRRSTSTVIARDGNDFYFKNLFSDLTEIGFKGTLKDDTIYVDIPQYFGNYGNNDLFLNLGKIVEQYGGGGRYSYTPEAVDTTCVLRFAYDKSTGTITSKNVICVTNLNAQIYSYLNHPIYKVFTDKKAVVPADAKTTYYTFTETAPNEQSESKSLVRIARAGNDFYFFDHDNMDTTAVFKGTLKEDKIYVDVPQYMGGMYFNYLHQGNIVKKDSVNYDYTIDENVHQIVFNYDSKTGSLSSDKLMVVSTIDGLLYNYFYKPNYKVYTPQAAVPVSPIILSWDSTYHEMMGIYLLRAKMLNQDTQGNYLNPQSMTYRMYFDGEVYEFTTDKYGRDFNNTTVDVPFEFHSDDFYIDSSDGVTHTWWLKDTPKDKVGIESTFTYNGVSKSSGITYIDVHTGVITGLTTPTVKTIKSEVYYDLSGRVVAEPTHGIYIHRVVYTDGSIRSFKLYKQ